MKKIIAVKTICNAASINIYSIDEEEEKIEVSLNDDTPKKYKLYYNKNGIYFNFLGHRNYLDEFVRV